MKAFSFSCLAYQKKFKAKFSSCKPWCKQKVRGSNILSIIHQWQNLCRATRRFIFVKQFESLELRFHFYEGLPLKNVFGTDSCKKYSNVCLNVNKSRFRPKTDSYSIYKNTFLTYEYATQHRKYPIKFHKAAFFVNYVDACLRHCYFPFMEK